MSIVLIQQQKTKKAKAKNDEALRLDLHNALGARIQPRHRAAAVGACCHAGRALKVAGAARCFNLWMLLTWVSQGRLVGGVADTGDTPRAYLMVVCYSCSPVMHRKHGGSRRTTRSSDKRLHLHLPHRNQRQERQERWPLAPCIT